MRFSLIFDIGLSKIERVIEFDIRYPTFDLNVGLSLIFDIRHSKFECEIEFDIRYSTFHLNVEYRTSHQFLIADTNGKVTNSQLDTTNENQEVRTFPAGDHKAHINRHVQRHSKRKTEKKHKRYTKKYRLGTVSKIFYWRV